MSEENEVIDPVQPEISSSDAPEQGPETIEPVEGQDAIAMEPVGDDDEDLPPHLQRKIGKIISKERKRLEAKFSRQVPQTAPTQAPEGTIYDAQIGEYVPLDSVPGQMAWREQLAEQKKIRDMQVQQQAVKNAEYEDLTERLSEGHAKYNNYQQALLTFSNMATPEMADALCGVDQPDAVVAYLSDKKGEIQRISRLKPAQQLREIFRIEQNLTPRKKLVTSAPAPVNKINKGNVAQGVRAEDMSTQQINDMYEKRFNTRAT